MFFYQNNSTSQNTTNIDLIELGKVDLNEMGTLPFVAPYYKGQMVPRESDAMCNEFGGDCFQFV
jgi:hypothetical protein